MNNSNNLNIIFLTVQGVIQNPNDKFDKIKSSFKVIFS